MKYNYYLNRRVNYLPLEGIVGASLINPLAFMNRKKKAFTGMTTANGQSNVRRKAGWESILNGSYLRNAVTLGKSVGGGQMKIYNKGYDVTDIYDFDPNVRPAITGLYPLLRNVTNYTNVSEKNDTHKNKIHIHRDMYFGK